MRYFARLSPLRAVRDLRRYLAGRPSYEIWSLMIALIVTTAVIAGFVRNSGVETEYRPRIIYVQQWRLDRTEAQIRAQQTIDEAKKQADRAALAKEQAKRQAQFKRIDDKLKSYGF